MTKQQLTDWLLDKINEAERAQMITGDFPDLGLTDKQLEQDVEACKELLKILGHNGATAKQKQEPECEQCGATGTKIVNSLCEWCAAGGYLPDDTKPPLSL